MVFGNEDLPVWPASCRGTVASWARRASLLLSCVRVADHDLAWKSNSYDGFKRTFLACHQRSPSGNYVATVSKFSFYNAAD